MTNTGYWDLQVNGYAGVDFNQDDLRLDDLEKSCEQMRADGVAGFLATIITDDVDVMCGRLETLAKHHRASSLVAQMLLGLHIEGPFISSVPGYVGAHPQQHARTAEPELARKLLDSAGGLTRIVTLAPECDPGMKATRLLADAGVCVSAGHCNPSLDELRAAIDAGLRMFTHLGNGCPSQMARHDNIIQRVLYLAEHLWIGLIGDGIHLPYFVLENLLRCAGMDRCFLVSDAISAAGCGPGRYTIGGQEVCVDENLATWDAAQEHLFGSACPLKLAIARLQSAVDIDAASIATLVSTNPRRAIGLET
ncbi:MAG: N-acetylglucosamine-6-phosphate deacetylase [Planctomycetales bacterium]|nr:N-acetylglucosamine-6-phosphate deacetylase [Planctomycetales bacterium]